MREALIDLYWPGTDEVYARAPLYVIVTEMYEHLFVRAVNIYLNNGYKVAGPMYFEPHRPGDTYGIFKQALVYGNN